MIIFALAAMITLFSTVDADHSRYANQFGRWYSASPGYNGAGAQQWRVEPNGDLVNPESGRCLDVTARVTANGSPVELWDCENNQSNQTWRLS